MRARSQHPIFVITHEFYPKHGGIATFTEEIARAAALDGHEIEVWAQEARKEAERPWPFTLRRMPLKGTHDFSCRARMALEFIKHRRRLRNATVYLCEPGPLLAMLPLQFFSSFLPKRLVLTFHGSEILKFKESNVQRPLMRKLIERATRISTLTKYSQQLLFKYFPEAKGKTVISHGALRSGIRTTSRQTTIAEDDGAHIHQKSVEHKLVILTVGRIHPRKGQLQTLLALQALPETLQRKVEYWIVGKPTPSQYEKNLRAEAARHNGLTVKFLGEIPDEKLCDIYAQADIFAMTSVPFRQSVEGFGLVYLEASAHGLPVVAHDIGGVPEAVLPGKTGLLVPHSTHDPRPLAAAFEKLIRDPELRRKLGTAGREWAFSKTWKDSARTLFSF